MSATTNYVRQLKEALDCLSSHEMLHIVSFLRSTLNSGTRIFLIGNGGSASLADHFATDWSKGIFQESDKRLNAISLTSNISLISAIGNDLSYDAIFKFQLKALANPEDTLFAISGSGNSKNILNATQYANSIGMQTIGICGFGGGKLRELAKICLVVDSFDMQIVEDVFSSVGHLIYKNLI